MKLLLRLCCAVAGLTSLSFAQIGNLAANGDGTDLLFTTYLSQAGSGQPAANKVFVLHRGALSLDEQSPYQGGLSQYFYHRLSVSQDGAVRSINRQMYCQGGSGCFFRELASTKIEMPGRTLNFDGNATVSRNGRFAVLYGNTNEAPGLPLPPGSVRLVDLQSGQIVRLGIEAATEGEFVADDGTVLVWLGSGQVRLVGMGKSIDLVAARSMRRAVLTRDGARIVYEAVGEPAEIRVIDVAGNSDRSLGSGSLPMVADDGRRFSFLNGVANMAQVWAGDSVSGAVRPLSNEPEGIDDQTISGDGAKVFAATKTGRLLSIDMASGVVTQLLGAPGPRLALLTAPVPGSYNELLGVSPADFVPNIRVGAGAAIVLGRTTRGMAIQIPWETPVGAKVTVASPEPAWEQTLDFAVVRETAGAALALGGGGAIGAPLYYGIHEDWSGLVTGENPARPGEVIHLYGTGYGPVDGVLPSGQPTPGDRPYRVTSACTWRAIGIGQREPRAIEAPFAGLAPGLVGLYQLDLRVPPDWTDPLFNAYCQFADPTLFLPTAAIYVRP